MQSADGAVMSHETQAAQTEEMHAVKALLMKQTAELDALKENMHAMQRRLAELQAQTEKTKKPQSTLPQQKSVP
jgi:septal ring factor EnvC (AmiA/AmiB activator)